MNITIHTGDALTELRKLPSSSVHCCVTSPPYWGLRDYGTGTWEGGNPDCKHTYIKGGVKASTIGGTGQNSDEILAAKAYATYKSRCKRCGARRVDEQIGLEDTVDEYVGKLVAVFGEVRRVLRDDGTLWLNLGDSYAENKGQVGAPWRVALALQAIGWLLRSDIVWHKPNAMPSSVKDRPTGAHEYIFLLSKRPAYFYDAAAIREPVTGSIRNRGGGGIGQRLAKPGKNNARPRDENYTRADRTNATERNKRSVWVIPHEPTDDEHFAGFPPALARTCILAGCPVDGVVLDPFTGRGTTGAVAVAHHRGFVGIDLKATYADLAARNVFDAAERAGVLPASAAAASTRIASVQVGLFGMEKSA